MDMTSAAAMERDCICNLPHLYTRRLVDPQPISRTLVGCDMQIDNCLYTLPYSGMPSET